MKSYGSIYTSFTAENPSLCDSLAIMQYAIKGTAKLMTNPQDLNVGLNIENLFFTINHPRLPQAKFAIDFDPIIFIGFSL